MASGKAVILGGEGQLGRALAASVPPGWKAITLGRPELDITNPAAVDSILKLELPTIVLNAAAYTAVDRCESEEEIAHAVNATAVGVLARVASARGAQFVHVSTDFVFDGTAGRPYAPDSATAPLGAYGRTKLAGERAAGADALIVRTAWVYAPTGSNFVRTMLKLMRERPEVYVVADQIGTPTYAPDLASAIWALAMQGARGIHHYTDSGVASWYDFAVAIQEEARTLGLLDKSVPIIPIATVDYPTPAARPSYSVLDKTATYAALGGPASHWRTNLRIMLHKVCQNG